MSLLDLVTVLYEDENMLVINKPAGLIVHPDGRRKEESVADWMIKNYPETRNIGEPITTATGEVILRPGIVHRLDRDTSGALLLAKNQETFEFLKNQFKERDIAKEYHAFVYGNIKKDEGIIDRPIARSRSDFRLWSAQRGSRGELREAITEYKVLMRGKDATFVEAKPRTGRTHQIRVHFKAINHPVVCDNLYAPKQKAILGFERTALHAYAIEFKKLDGTSEKVIAPHPKDFENAIKELQTTA
jgi:23S rRNA pseudouridine1911/1915/1917 synthase